MLYLMGFDLLTGVFTLAPLAVFDKRPGATWAGVLRNWGLVFVGDFAGALGMGPNVEIDYRCLVAEVGDLYLLATDGAYMHLDAAAVHVAVAQGAGDLNEAARALVAAAKAQRATDDMTVQLLRIDGLPEPRALNLPVPRTGLALPSPMAPRRVFEAYTIVRELHASSRSHVHLAVDDATGQQVVLKMPSVDLAGDPWVARRIHSPHVLRPARGDRPRQHVYVAMEFVDGQTLSQWMTDTPMPDRNGTVKLIDFGSAHVAGLAEGVPGARANAIAGTPQCTAPEYFVGHGGDVRSDLFSLAVLTCQMLTGQLPYGLQVVRLRSSTELKQLRYGPVRHWRPELPEWLDGLMA